MSIFEEVLDISEKRCFWMQTWQGKPFSKACGMNI